MISLTDSQLQTVMGAGAKLEPERRDIFLRRVGAMLRVRGRFTDTDVADVARLAMAGLIHTDAARDGSRLRTWCGHSSEAAAASVAISHKSLKYLCFWWAQQGSNL